MKRIAPVLLILLFAANAHGQSCPSNVTAISPSATSCWPLQETSGTVITDTTSANNGTISGTGYTLNQQGGIACSNANGSGCNISTAVQYVNPQPMSLYADFVGTNGGMLQLGTSSSTSATPYFALWLDTYGHLTFGVNNFQTLQVLQSPQWYGDGNEHKALISIGTAGMKMYVDGDLVASTGVKLSSYANGYWLFGGMNQANWPYGPTNQYFNGTLITFAWWNGTQFTDYQGKQITGGIPTAITNNYCTFSNQIASNNPATAQAWANKKLTFQSTQLQVPGLGSSLPIAPSTIVCSTDGSGNIVTGCQLPQGEHVNLSVGYGNPIPIIIPAQTSCDLTAILASQTDPPEVVSSVAVAGPVANGAIVTNPPAGQIGTSTITWPPTFSQTQSSAATLNIIQNGNSQQVIMTGNVAITLGNWQSGAVFTVDTEDFGGSFAPTFSVLSGNLVWSGGGSQPAMPAEGSGVHVLWIFQAVASNILVGSLQAAGAGTFPLAATGNANNFSITNVNTISMSTVTPPSIAATATCTGTCATSYQYELTCNLDNNTETIPSGATTATNASSLSVGNNNALNWTGQSTCYNGYNVYGRTSGSLGLLAHLPFGTNTYTDNGSASPGAAPPTYNGTGRITGTNLAWAMGTAGSASFNTTDFMPLEGSAFSGTESLEQQPAPVQGTVHNMRCAGANTSVLTLRKNGSGTLVSCTVSSGVCNDTTDAVNVAAGDLLDTELVSGAGGNATCSYQIN